MPKPGVPDLVFFQEVKSGDVLKLKGKSNVDEAAGGGARDLRIPKQFGTFLEGIFAKPGTEKGVSLCTVHWENKDGSVGHAEMELWRPTGARPAELRIARIGDVLAWQVDEAAFKADEAKGRRWFFLLVKDSNGVVWARLLYETNLDGEDSQFREYVRRRIRETPGNESIRGTIRWKEWTVEPP
ncbi:MAG TPA: hypothetical protein VEU73_13925 [Gemmatimonadales bacterium]|nr:hypothetical protein [Gemmatimonadales bacterium]